MKRLQGEEGAGELRPGEHSDSILEPEAIAFRRDRLLAALTLIGGGGLPLALPFALRAGSEFSLPVAAALVIAIALVPMLEWLERRRVPSTLAAFTCVLVLIAMANVAVASIVLPAAEWVRLLPERIGRVRDTLAPLMEVYSDLNRFINDIVDEFGTRASNQRTVALETPNSLLDIIAASAPHAAIQMFFALLVIFFFLAGWTRMRRRTITARSSFDGAM